MNATIMFETTCLPLPITSLAKDTAQRFSQGQSTPEKSRQVQLNTLAVCVVRDYLELMAIDVDLSQSDSWNRGMQTVLDTADIMLPGLGRVECRPLVQPLESLNSSSTCTVPIEVQADRIGYVVVQIDEDLQQANILGFSQGASGDRIVLKDLQPIVEILDLLPENVPGPIATAINSLGEWIHDFFEEGWETLDNLLKPYPAYAFRGRRDTIQRGKVIHLSSRDFEHPTATVTLGLVLSIKAKTTDQEVLIQLVPLSQQLLPSGVTLNIIDSSTSTIIDTVQARAEDAMVQRKIEGEPGEAFGVQVVLSSETITEEFVI
jgi:Protein of unknown function (DUF1822)